MASRGSEPRDDDPHGSTSPDGGRTRARCVRCISPPVARPIRDPDLHGPHSSAHCGALDPVGERRRSLGRIRRRPVHGGIRDLCHGTHHGQHGDAVVHVRERVDSDRSAGRWNRRSHPCEHPRPRRLASPRPSSAADRGERHQPVAHPRRPGVGVPGDPPRRDRWPPRDGRPLDAHHRACADRSAHSSPAPVRPRPLVGRLERLLLRGVGLHQHRVRSHRARCRTVRGRPVVPLGDCDRRLSRKPGLPGHLRPASARPDPHPVIDPRASHRRHDADPDRARCDRHPDS